MNQSNSVAKNRMNGFKSENGYNICRSDLKEKQVYLSTLYKNGRILHYRCLYAVINGELRIHRSSNWEDIPHSDLTVDAFLPYSPSLAIFPSQIGCFVDTGKAIQE